MPYRDPPENTNPNNNLVDLLADTASPNGVPIDEFIERMLAINKKTTSEKTIATVKQVQKSLAR